MPRRDLQPDPFEPIAKRHYAERMRDILRSPLDRTLGKSPLLLPDRDIFDGDVERGCYYTHGPSDSREGRNTTWVLVDDVAVVRVAPEGESERVEVIVEGVVVASVVDDAAEDELVKAVSVFDSFQAGLIPDLRKQPRKPVRRRSRAKVAKTRRRKR